MPASAGCAAPSAPPPPCPGTVGALRISARDGGDVIAEAGKVVCVGVVVECDGDAEAIESISAELSTDGLAVQVG